MVTLTVTSNGFALLFSYNVLKINNLVYSLEIISEDHSSIAVWKERKQPH